MLRPPDIALALLSALLLPPTAAACTGGLLEARAVRPDPSTWKRTRCGSPAAGGGGADIPSEWGSRISAHEQPLPEHPRPMLVRYDRRDEWRLATDRNNGDRRNWMNLNGLWEWQPDDASSAATATADTADTADTATSPPPFGKKLSSSILVPFPIEACLSGVAPPSSSEYVTDSWYRLVIEGLTLDEKRRHGRYLLHFGAVDWKSTLYVGGTLLATHTGGYDGFSADITAAVAESDGRPLEILLHVHDPGDIGHQPNGKQRVSAISDPGGDTYTPASGIWQTVWLEEVPASAYIADVRIAADSTSLLTVTALVEPAATNETHSAANGPDDESEHLVLFEVLDLDGSGDVIASRTAPAGTAAHIQVPSPRLWAPGTPNLYPLRISTVGASATGDDGGVLSYFGLRTFALPIPPKPSNNAGGTQVDAVPLLNGREVYLAGWLDQSYWPDGIYTAPADDALACDLEAVHRFGLNMVRLHQKVNPQRWYYHADRLGIVVFQDAVQKYGGATNETIPLFESDLVAMIEGRANHPCIVQWTAFNEADCWRVFKDPPHAVADVGALARSTDWQNRLVDTDSGGGANGRTDVTGDVNDVHSYPWPSDPLPTPTKYAMIGEFGGIGTFVEGREWAPGRCYAYLVAPTPENASATYVQMADEIMRRTDHLRASVFTQITDVERECDGWLNYDRSTKFSSRQREAIADANRALIASVGGMNSSASSSGTLFEEAPLTEQTRE